MEMLARAQASRHLQDVELGCLGDVDWLRAAGAIGAAHSLALAAWRLVELGDRRTAAEVFGGLWAEALKLELPVEAVYGVAAYLVDPRCPACGGRGAAVVPNTPMLAAEKCTACEGTKDGSHALDAGTARLLDRLRELEANARAAIIALMR
jgi:hypothetical protein